ncbi:hypothetical protein T310_8724, partial [Rasamsonia emersonii CBS 393.64]
GCFAGRDEESQAKEHGGDNLSRKTNSLREKKDAFLTSLSDRCQGRRSKRIQRNTPLTSSLHGPNVRVDGLLRMERLHLTLPFLPSCIQLQLD